MQLNDNVFHNNATLSFNCFINTDDRLCVTLTENCNVTLLAMLRQHNTNNYKFTFVKLFQSDREPLPAINSFKNKYAGK